MAQDHAIEHGTDNYLLFGIEPRDGLELKAQLIVGAAFGLSKKQHICTHAESYSELADYVERGLGRAAFVAAELDHMNANPLGQGLLCKATVFAQSGQVLRKL